MTAARGERQTPGSLLKHMNVKDEKRLQRILNRWIRGYAFMAYPTAGGHENAVQYRTAKLAELNWDNEVLSKKAFEAKYGAYDY